MVGVKLAHAHQRFRMDDERYWSIYALAAAHDAPVYLHTGPSPFPGTSQEAPYTDPAYLEAAIAANPDTDFILGHLGHDFINQRVGDLQGCIDSTSRYENVWLEPSALGSRSSDPEGENLTASMRHPGRGLVDRVVYGSDGPCVPWLRRRLPAAHPRCHGPVRLQRGGGGAGARWHLRGPLWRGPLERREPAPVDVRRGGGRAARPPDRRQPARRQRGGALGRGRLCGLPMALGPGPGGPPRRLDPAGRGAVRAGHPLAAVGRRVCAGRPAVARHGRGPGGVALPDGRPGPQGALRRAADQGGRAVGVLQPYAHAGTRHTLLWTKTTVDTVQGTR